MSNFFDFREKMTKPARVVSSSPAESGAPLSVSQLTARIDSAIRGGLPGNLLVKGEVSRPSYHRSSGHLYFTMKDAGACIDAVMWKSDVARLKFEVENGQELLATGKVQLYAQQGKYQLYVSRLAPVGAGALELALKQMRAKLEAQGLFAVERKKPLPAYPSRIAIITSRSTAAFQDILKVLARFRFLKLFIYDVPVQGDGAGKRIATAVTHLSQRHQDCGGIDLIILSRGGGSLEDLWQFNDESVARAIAASALPIITGIGHEIDTSIADLVADYHAHTPTEAASVAIRNWLRASELLAAGSMRLASAARSNVSQARQRLAGIERHELFRRPKYRIESYQQFMDDRERAFDAAIHSRIAQAAVRIERLGARLTGAHPRHSLTLNRQRLTEMQRRLRIALAGDLRKRQLRLDALEAQLRVLSPMAVLARGYSITTLKRDGSIVRSATAVKEGDRLSTRLADGAVESVARDSKQKMLFEP
jgi:exodeoxyribonuclease VII large subunit